MHSRSLAIHPTPRTCDALRCEDATLTINVPSAFDTLVSRFGEGEFAPLQLAIRTTGSATSPANLAALYDYSRRLAADPRIHRIVSIVDVDPRLRLEQYQLLYGSPSGPPDRYIQATLAATTRNDLTTFTIFTVYGANRPEARGLVADLRSTAGTLAPPAGMQVLVGGGAAEVTDVVNEVGAEFPKTGLFILVTTYLVLLVLLRSVVLPAKASLPLQIKVSATTTGRFPMLVRILTPTGVPIVPAPGDQPPQIVVRSTQYNRVALAITIGAVLFLAVWWGRRFLPRPTS